MSDQIDPDVITNIVKASIPINLLGAGIIYWKYKKITNPLINKSFTKSSIWMMYQMQGAVLTCVIFAFRTIYRH